MGIADIFRPKWKHSNVGVRSAAVRELDSDEQRVLKEIASSDGDPTVRRIAVKKLADPEVLSQISINDPDPAIRKLANDKLVGLLIEVANGEDQERAVAALNEIVDQRALAVVASTSPHPSVSGQALNKIFETRLLVEVVRDATSQQMSIAALDRIDDEASLKAIAIDDERKEIALLALERVDSSELAHEIMKKAKSRAVRTRAKKIIAHNRAQVSVLAADAEDLKKKEAKRAQLCRQVELLRRERDLVTAESRLEDLIAQWEALGDDAQGLVANRWNRVCSGVAGVLSAARQKQSAYPGATTEKAGRDSARGAAIGELSPPFSTQGEGRAEEPDLEVLQGLLDRASRIARQGNLTQVGRIKASLLTELSSAGHNADAEIVAKLKLAQQRLEQREQDLEQHISRRFEQQVGRVEKLCTDLEQLRDSDDLRKIDRAIKEASRGVGIISSLKDRKTEERLKERLEDARRNLVLRREDLRESQEWRQWSNLPLKEELCRLAEDLTKQEDLRTVAREVRSLQRRWKAIGAVPASRSVALWARFKAACDQAYLRCASYFAELDLKRAEALQRKIEICERAEELSEREDWEKTATEIKDLQAKWKEIGPVRRQQADEIWRRFRVACDLFFDRRKAHYEQSNAERKENLKRKIEICEEVEKLSESKEWKVTSEKIKSLTQIWKKIGPVPRKKSEAIWERFRSACDRFFQNMREERDDGLYKSLRQCEEICAQVEEMIKVFQTNETSSISRSNEEGPEAEGLIKSNQIESLLDDQSVEKVLLAYRQWWATIGRVPSNRRRAVEARFEESIEKLLLAYPRSFAKTILDPESNSRRREKICLHLEMIVSDIAPEKAAPTAVERGDIAELDSDGVADKLRRALDENVLGGKDIWDWADRDREVEEMKSEWRSSGPVLGERGESLRRRYASALAEIEQRRPFRQHVR